MLQLLTQSSWADRIGWVLVHSLWQFALVGLATIVLRRALQRCSAATRYGALLTAMIIMVAMPVATWFSPWLVPAPAAAVKPEPVENVENVSPLQPLDDTLPMAARPAASPLEVAAEPEPEPQRVEPLPTGPASSWSLVKSRVEPWLPEIVLAWFVGVVVAAFRLLWSWHTVRRLRRAGISPVGDAVHGVLERTARRLGLARTVEALQSSLVKMPVVLGCFRPVVLLPLCIVTGLPAAQLEMILAHELAHIRRHDYLVNLLQTLVETLFFYHPAVWWLSRQIRNERENCCDDVAMALAGSRAEYGRALLAIEELRAASPALSLAAGGGSLLARIRRIAGREPTPRVVGGGSILGVILVSLAIAVAATWGAADSADSRTQQGNAETVVVGQVVDATGKGAAAAQVAVVSRSRNNSTNGLLDDEQRLLGSTKADGEGRFRLSIPKLSSAAYLDTKLVAVAAGFNLGWRPIGEDVENPSVTVTLAAEQTIHGRVLDAGGRPAADTKVCVTSFGKRVLNDFDGIQCWMPPSQVPFWPQPRTTDREGRFTLRGVDRSQMLNVQAARRSFCHRLDSDWSGRRERLRTPRYAHRER